VLKPFTFAVLLFITASSLAQTATGSKNSAKLDTGVILPNIAVTNRAGQNYALYLPSQYTPEKRWPIVYAFDPAARGTAPAELMKQAAEQYGYIIAASNNSRNGPMKASAEAAQAVWADTHARLSIDEKRVYFAGFSGGARVASYLAQSCKCVHGVFLSGAGFSPEAPPSPGAVFAVFLTAGLTDFNYGEITQVNLQLEQLGFPHFLQRFDGSHEWAPADVWPEAFAWADLLAMKDKRRPRDDAFIAAELDHFTAQAQKAEQSGNLYFVAGTYRQTVATFDGLTSVEVLAAHAAALEKNPVIVAARKREKSDFELQASLESDILKLTGGLRDQTDRRIESQQQTTGAITQLRQRAEHEKDTEKRRVLERARFGVFVAMMETGSPLIDSKDLPLARIYLELAIAARPESSWPHVSLARCLAKMGDKKGALQSLKHATEAGLTAQELANLPTTAPEFAALASDPGFQKLCEAAVSATKP